MAVHLLYSVTELDVCWAFFRCALRMLLTKSNAISSNVTVEPFVIDQNTLKTHILGSRLLVLNRSHHRRLAMVPAATLSTRPI